MKKVLALMVALCMALGMISAVAEGNDVSGSWYIEVYGMPFELQLNEDGTASMAGQEGTWEATENGVAVTLNGSTAEGTVTDGGLVLTADGETQTFTREAPVVIEIAEPKADPALEDFNGVYTVKYIKLLDNFISAEKAGELGAMKMPDITIENGAISLSELDAFSEEDLLAALMSLFVSETAELQDGKLVSHAETETLNTSMSITLLEDGMISVDLLGGDTVLQTCIYAPAAEDAAPTFDDMPMVVTLDEDAELTDADFEGDWVVDKVFIDTAYLTPEEVEAYGLKMNPIRIAGGQIINIVTDEQGEHEAAETYTLENNQIVFSDGEGIEAVIEKLEDGNIVLTIFIPREDGTNSSASFFMVHPEA